MSILQSPKSEIYNKLKETGYTVYQNRPEVLGVLPCIVFSIGDNSGVYTFTDLGYQNIIVDIDIYADTSTGSSTILTAVESEMRELGYMLTSSLDIPDPDLISHVSATFNLSGY